MIDASPALNELNECIKWNQENGFEQNLSAMLRRYECTVEYKYASRLLSFWREHKKEKRGREIRLPKGGFVKCK